ncbi:MAG: hypothetical protein ABL308_03515 [Oceanicaulis sp.]
MLRLIAYGGLGAVLTAMVIAVGAWGVLRVIPPEPPEPYAGMTGMEILEAHACHRAESKQIIVRGVEDGFSPDGDERAVIREALRTPLAERRGLAGYDHPGLDGHFIDHLNIPAHTAAGLVVIALRPNGGGWENDAAVIGNLTDWATGARAELRRLAGTTILQSNERDGWTWTGRFLVVDLKAVQLGDWLLNAEGDRTLHRHEALPATLLDYVRGHDQTAPLDIRVYDDMSVDFVGAALCLEPRPRRGLTWNLVSSIDFEPSGTVVFISAPDSPGETQSNPFSGNTLCSEARPLLCFLDRRDPVPEIDRVLLERAGAIWSGGEVRATDPVRGDQFATLADARAFCAEAFGDEWRVAAFHDGNHPGRLQAYGEMEDPHPPVWVDIRGQPHATCWEPAP